MDPACPKCSYVHDPRKCTSHRSSERDDDGNLLPCGNFPRHGSAVCVSHGAHAGQVKKKAARNVELEKAQGEFGALMDECRVKVEGRSQTEAMTVALDLVAMVVAAIQLQLANLGLRAVWEFETVKGPQGGTQRLVNVSAEGVVGPNHQGETKVHPLLDELRDWLTLYGRLVKNAADMGIQERMAKVTEIQVAATVQALERMAVEDGRDPVEEKRRFARHLTLIESEGRAS